VLNVKVKEKKEINKKGHGSPCISNVSTRKRRLVRLLMVPLDDIRPLQSQHETKQKVTLRWRLKLISPSVKDVVDGNKNISESCQANQKKTRVEQAILFWLGFYYRRKVFM
jgi:hypothetical protein